MQKSCLRQSAFPKRHRKNFLRRYPAARHSERAAVVERVVEAQRAGIVRALINNPMILFADEPTGALNSQTGLDVLNTLTQFNEQGQSVVMVTHDMRSARRGNRILYLKDGVILGECNLGRYQHGDPARHEKLSAFLTEMGW